MSDENLIFLSYSSPDRDKVLPFLEFLEREGFNPWLDKNRILGGQNWDIEIKRALKKATIIVVFLSENSVNRRGYAIREIKIALDQALDRLSDDIYIIPVMLTPDLPIPEQLADIQAIGLGDDDPFLALKKSVEAQLDRMGVATEKVEQATSLSWSFTTYKEEWDGIPGYDATFNVPMFSSQTYEKISDISNIIRGEMLTNLMTQRSVKLHQDSSIFSSASPKYSRQNYWDAFCGGPDIQGRVLSITYNVSWMGARAAHPNSHFKTFVFCMDPLIRISSLEEVFEDGESGLEVVRDEVRNALLTPKENSEYELGEEWVNSGTEKWENFSNFSFTEEGIELLFAPYDIAAYAFGPQSVMLPYEKITAHMDTTFLHLLDLKYRLDNPDAKTIWRRNSDD